MLLEKREDQDEVYRDAIKVDQENAVEEQKRSQEADRSEFDKVSEFEKKLKNEVWYKRLSTFGLVIIYACLLVSYLIMTNVI